MAKLSVYFKNMYLLHIRDYSTAPSHLLLGKLVDGALVPTKQLTASRCPCHVVHGRLTVPTGHQRQAGRVQRHQTITLDDRQRRRGTGER